MIPHENMLFSRKDDQTETVDMMIGDSLKQFLVSIHHQSSRMTLIDPKTGERLDINLDKNFPVSKRINDLVEQSFSLPRAKTIQTEITEIYDLSTESNIVIRLPEDTIVSKIEIMIDTPFSSANGMQHNIVIRGANGEILVPETWSDPNIAGVYSSTLNYQVGKNNYIVIEHDLKDTITGSATIKLHEYRPLLSSEYCIDNLA